MAGTRDIDRCQGLWSEFWKLGEARTNAPGIRARATLAQPAVANRRQFVVETGSGHHFLVDDTAGGTGPKPIESWPPRWPGARRLT